MEQRNGATGGPVALVFAAALIATSEGHATHRPGHGGGGGGGNGGGTIYYVDTDGGVLRYFATDPDGQNVVQLGPGVGSGEPSQDLHGGHQWFLQPRSMGGQLNPDGSTRRELFATRDDGLFDVQLTSEPDLDQLPCPVGHVNARWTVNAQGERDARITWTARRFDLDTGQVVEAGLYRADVLFDASGNVLGLASQPAAPLVPRPIVDCLGLAGPDFYQHDNDPTGTRIVYNPVTSGELRIIDLANGNQETFLTNGGDPRWSPDGLKIKFQRGDC